MAARRLGRISRTGGFQVVSWGGEAIAAAVESGGFEVVSRNGVTTNAIVESGGFEIVSAFGTASATHVRSGGTLVVLANGAASSTTSATGAIVVSSGVIMMSGGQFVSATESQVLSNSVVGSGATEFVLSHGVTTSAMVAGGVQFVDGGFADNTTVGAGGARDRRSPVRLFVRYRGRSRGRTDTGIRYAYSTTVDSGGYAVLSFGVLSNATVGDGGDLIVGAGSALTMTIDSGGLAVLLGSNGIAGGGLASGTTIENGGTLIVMPGAQVVSPNQQSGGVMLSSGVVTISGGRVVDVAGTPPGAVLTSGATAVRPAIWDRAQFPGR